MAPGLLPPNGIGISLVAFSIVIGFGFGIATATLVGQHLGAGQPDQALMAVSRSLRMAVAAMTILSILLAVYAEPLARFMIEDDEVVELTVVFIYFIAFAQPLMAFEFTLGGALRGAGDTRSPLIATFCGIILGRLIPALVFLWMELSVYWIFAVMLFDYIIKAYDTDIPVSRPPVVGSEIRHLISLKWRPGCLFKHTECRQRQKKYLKLESPNYW